MCALVALYCTINSIPFLRFSCEVYLFNYCALSALCVFFVVGYWCDACGMALFVAGCDVHFFCASGCAALWYHGIVFVRRLCSYVAFLCTRCTTAYHRHNYFVCVACTAVTLGYFSSRLLLLLLLEPDGVAAFFRLLFFFKSCEFKGASLQLYVPRAAREELKALGPDFEAAYKVGRRRYRVCFPAPRLALTTRTLHIVLWLTGL